MKSYLKNRRTYCKIQGYISSVKSLGDKSVIQGSRMASLNYTIYTIEIGKIDMILKEPELLKMFTDKEYDNEAIKESNHNSISYVDDLSQITANKSFMTLQIYIQTVYEVTIKFFSTNLLAVNPEKTEILVVPPKGEQQMKAYIMTVNGDLIESSSQVKILGVKFDSNNSMNSHVASIASRIGMNFQQLKPFLKHASMQQRKTILCSKLESIALYTSPLFLNESHTCTKRLESVIMTIYKWIYNKCTYRKKYSDICKEIKIEEPSQTLLKNNAKFICKIMYEEKVKHLTELMIVNPRVGTKIYLVDPQKQHFK